MIQEDARIIMRFGAELQKKLLSRLSNEVSRGNITVPQYNVLLNLKESGLTTMSHLAKGLDVTMAATTTMIDKLLDAGLVRRERSREDRRVVKVEITRKGAKVVEEFREQFHQVIITILDKLTSSERKQLVYIHRKIHTILNQGNL